MINNSKINRLISYLERSELVFIPTLGPVYRKDRSVKHIVEDVLTISNNTDFLPYDKDRRWGGKKTEQLLPKKIFSVRNGIIVPTVVGGSKAKIILHYYSTKPLCEQAQTMITESLPIICEGLPVLPIFIRSFLRPQFGVTFTHHHTYLKTFSNADLVDTDIKVRTLNDLSPDIRRTFRVLGNTPEMEGFAFLDQFSYQQSRAVGKIFCVVEDNLIIGAIGPQEILLDYWKQPYLAPQYFGVLPSHRHKGYASLLWNQAMRWGQVNKAKYSIFQAIADSPADYFYKREGIKIAGNTFLSLLGH